MHSHSCPTCAMPPALSAANTTNRPKTGTTIIELADVSYAYEEQDVLTNVTLTVKANDFLAIIGPNGGGKTTLVKLILGLLSPKSGTVRVLGADPKSARAAIGYVPQHTAAQPGFPLTVSEAALLGLRRTTGRFRHWPGYSAAEKRKALDILEMVDMADMAKHRFDTLSGGQKQRVLVARALISGPSLLLFDEPTSNIDPQGKLCVFDLLAALSASITIVMVSHDLISASTHINSVAVVNQTLIQNPSSELTPDMLQLIYGSHDASCPLDGYIRNVSSILGKEVSPS